MNAPANGCGSDVAAYLLGALTDEEARRFEAHLRGCELCRTDLAALRPVVDALPAAAEQVDPPPALRSRIMGVVEEEARERRRAAAPRRAAPSWFPSLRPATALAAVCVLLLVGVGAGVGISVIGGDDGVVRGDCIRACERVAMTMDGRRATLKIAGMRQPPDGRVYQVWTQRFGEDPRPTDALFSVDRRGSASVDVPGATEEVDQVLVTDEPPGGSAAPSTAPYLAVRL
jgi:anti-sigma-K factor RskA